MPDETDRFSGLGDSLSEGDANSSQPESESDSSTAASTESQSEPAPAEAHPAPFAFDETELKSYYVRPETFAGISKGRSIVRTAAAKHGLAEDDVSQSEIQDAELSLLQSIDGWETLLAKKVLERRGIEPNEDDIESIVDVLTS